jgi:ribosome biogenesis GTPase / thiamine phosphate phosphatase
MRPTPARSSALERLGWGPAFTQQIDVYALTTTPPVRVVAAIEDGSVDSVRLP